MQFIFLSTAVIIFHIKSDELKIKYIPTYKFDSYITYMNQISSIL